MRQRSNLLFGLFLLFIRERALRSLIYFFSSAAPNDYSKFGPITFFFIGPFLLLYVCSILKPKSIVVFTWKYHVLFWVLVALGIHVVFPFRSDPIFWKKYILTGINLQWLMYTLVAFGLIINRVYHSKARTEKYSITNRWLLILLMSVLVLWCIYFLISFTYFVVGSIAFSLIFYTFYLYLIFNRKQITAIFQIEKRYASIKIDDKQSEKLIKKLTVLMQDEKPYKNSSIRLTDLAKKLNISTHQLSQLLNDNLGKRFSEFVNEYRIDEAKQLIESNSKFTLDGIGNEAGFNSKSTFYNAFKRIVGMTPSKYREQFFGS